MIKSSKTEKYSPQRSTKQKDSPRESRERNPYISKLKEEDEVIK